MEENAVDCNKAGFPFWANGIVVEKRDHWHNVVGAVGIEGST